MVLRRLEVPKYFGNGPTYVENGQNSMERVWCFFMYAGVRLDKGLFRKPKTHQVRLPIRSWRFTPLQIDFDFAAVGFGHSLNGPAQVFKSLIHIRNVVFAKVEVNDVQIGQITDSNVLRV